MKAVSGVLMLLVAGVAAFSTAPFGVQPRSQSCQCQRTRLFSSVTGEAEPEAAAVDEDVPKEVAALDGIMTPEEAHNAERPARGALKKKRAPRGKPLSEFEVGSTVKGKVRTITNYGGFVDIGAQTDGLLHISQLSMEFVSDAKEILEVGQELDVRIVSIDEEKNQVALTLLTEEQVEEAQQTSSRPRQERRNAAPRRDDSAVMKQLNEKGWDPNQFVEGTVVNTVAFGAFVRIDASTLNSEVEGNLDGLVHISALSVGRADSVTSIVNVDDKVQVRMKSIMNNKVSLSMIAPEDEPVRGQNMEGSLGAKDWKEQLERLQTDMPQFVNKPDVVDLRK